MSVQKFTAQTSREALAKAKSTFGERTLIFSTRPVVGGVEVTAAEEDRVPATRGVRIEEARLPSPANSARVQESASVAQDTEALAMSTLSFQQYVRERLLRKRHEEAGGPLAPAPSNATPAAPQARPIAPARSAAEAPAMDANDASGLHAEIRHLKALMEDRFHAVAWLGEARRRPQITALMLKLSGAGYSSDLIRTLLLNFPVGLTGEQAVARVAATLAENLPTDAGKPTLLEAGGTLALVGASGVGKSTAIAALAARCVEQHGAASVGIVTLDALRPGGHEQLRYITRELGVVAHAAPDEAAFRDLLQLWSGKHMVLIDTPGITPNGQGLDALRLLDFAGLEQLLVVSAAVDREVQHAFFQKMLPNPQVTGVVLTRRDEALKLGPIINNLVRHRIPLRGSTMGRPTAHNWQGADAFDMVTQTLKAPGELAFMPEVDDLPMLFNRVGPLWAMLGQA
ncbi:MAG: flagellar biosynthesis protein FlhF [Polaromonas sp.]|jgi:flagellar biosynthesis protein FlhF